MIYHNVNTEIYYCQILETDTESDKLNLVPTYLLNPIEEAIVFTKEQFNKLLEEFGEELLKAARGEIYLEPQYCVKCKK